MMGDHKVKKREYIKLIIGGDFCLRWFRNKSPEDLFSSNIVNLVREADWGIVNLECPITTSKRKFLKVGHFIRGDKRELEYLQYLGFNVLTLANNHIKDYGEKGVLDTIEGANNRGFNSLGAGKNVFEAMQPLVLTKYGIKIGLINVSDAEFAYATKKSAGASPFFIPEVSEKIMELRSQVDTLIVIVHAGIEHYHYPYPKLVTKYRFLLKIGADVVIGHHPHVVQGIEKLHGKYIFYSIGNFFFPSRIKSLDVREGILLKFIISLKDKSVSSEVIPIISDYDNGFLDIMSGAELKRFLINLTDYNNILKDNEEIDRRWDNYIDKQKVRYLAMLTAPNKFIYNLLSYWGKFIKYSEWRFLLWENLFRCESHRESVVAVLEKLRLKRKENL